MRQNHTVDCSFYLFILWEIKQVEKSRLSDSGQRKPVLPEEMIHIRHVCLLTLQPQLNRTRLKVKWHFGTGLTFSKQTGQHHCVQKWVDIIKSSGQFNLTTIFCLFPLNLWQYCCIGFTAPTYLLLSESVKDILKFWCYFSVSKKFYLLWLSLTFNHVIS